MIPANISSELANHLWQSTVVATIAWLLAVALRKNHARTRYWIWLVASLKFLVPFSLLIAIGSSLAPTAAVPLAQPTLSTVMERVTQPFPDAQSLGGATTAAMPHNADLVPLLLFALWACGVVAVALSWWRGWRRIRLTVRAAAPLALAADVPVLSSQLSQEPGIFGIARPVLLLPDGILDRLTPAQLDAIVAHEMCHVERRDNLTFAMHMAVTCLFWFHPLVWWIGARLVEERERACDEAVLQSGRAAPVYAEGILNVCKFYVESPMVCVSGVSGSDLKKRIVRIMTEQVAHRLDLSRKLLLCAAGLVAVAVPIVFGLMHSAPMHAQSQAESTPLNLPKFDVVSIKPSKAFNGMMGIMLRPDGINITGTPAQMMIRQAFGVEDDRIIGAPGWVKSDRFDVEAKVAPEDVEAFRKVLPDERSAMMLPVLEDRFHLKYHHEMRELPMYALVIAKGGPKLKQSSLTDTPEMKGPVKDGAPPMPPGPGNGAPPQRRLMMMGMGNMEAQGSPLSHLAHVLSSILGHTVEDKTGLKGNYDFTLHWTPDDAPPMGAADNGQPAADAPPPIFTAVQEQLGLKLDSIKGKVDVIVIDHIEQPSPN